MVETGQGGPPPRGGDRDRGALLLGVLWAQAGIATVIIFLRLYARFMIHTTGWDDWLMFLTLAIFIGSIIIVTLQDSVGGYRHLYYLDKDAAVRALELNFILRGVHIIGYATGKASIGAFILRLIGRQNMWQKWVVWVLIIFTTLVNVLNCIFNFVQCSPVQGNWDPRVSAKCWEKRAQLKFAYFMCSENIAADAVLAIIPATFLFNMNLSLKKRINMTILLGLGSMATICGIIKTVELNSIRDDPDFTWGLYAVTVWALSEIFVIITCGSVPALKPLWDRYIVRRFSENNSECHGNWFENYRMRHVYHARLQSGSAQARHTPKSESTSRSLWSSDPGVQTTTSTTKHFNINTAGERDIETIQEPQSAV
ncbi:hypothetical protein KXV95_001126 [Aspergillus fumigatus]|nr:hypothetical protein KXX51_009208 [Aspergillus fumigatus]KAH1575467.1 hypothetical protein KXX28_000174 [Aspergillus fumigatus]KAH1791239.1 hypothetical protein KXX36_004647 [Aspergillus fumigatus]KAH1794649.1 hypothetical protein KXX62_008014 [Aspergillus fumigatus]KAH2118484.1 hypothetical protein KXV46_001265 [Aspergillus fumigatus]